LAEDVGALDAPKTEFALANAMRVAAKAAIARVVFMGGIRGGRLDCPEIDFPNLIALEGFHPGGIHLPSRINARRMWPWAGYTPMAPSPLAWHL
jgi:hypothetical protein